jgi:hypothetical protein
MTSAANTRFRTRTGILEVFYKTKILAKKSALAIRTGTGRAMCTVLANKRLSLAVQHVLCALTQRVLYHLNAFFCAFITPFRSTQSHMFDVATNGCSRTSRHDTHSQLSRMPVSD